MRIIRCVFLPAAMLALTGCIPLFLHAGYTAKDVVVESRLVGTWIEADHSKGMTALDTLSFRPEGDRAYRVTFRKGDHDPDSLVFLGHLFRAGAATLIDLEPHPSNVVFAYYVPAHTFGSVALSGDRLVWGELSLGWVTAAARRGGRECPVDTVVTGQSDSSFVLACGTPAVHRLLVEAASDPEAFAKETLLRSDAAGGR